MANHCADLGALDLVSTTSGLALALTSQAHLLPFTECVEDFRLTPDALLSGTAENAVICVQSALDIRLTIETVDECGHVDAVALTRRLAAKLEHAQVNEAKSRTDKIANFCSSGASLDLNARVLK